MASDQPSSCDFCGEMTSGRVFGPTHARPGGTVQICEACVRLCASALDPEAEEEEAPREEATDPARPQPERLKDWTPFEHEGMRLEWSAGRATHHSCREVYVVRVRNGSGDVVMTQLYPHTPRNEDVEAALELSERGYLSRLERAPTFKGETTNGLTWSAEHGVVVQAEPSLDVSVRKAGSAHAGCMVGFAGWNREPTVQDAESVVQMNWRRLKDDKP